MIEHLRGNVLLNEEGHAIIDVGGVGYGLETPTTTFAFIPETGAEVSLWVYTHTTDQGTRLFGFPTREERELFQVFIGVSQIGPRTALAILSSFDIGDFARAILADDLNTLVKIPGVGRKTAERLVVELRDKMTGVAAMARAKKRGPAGALTESPAPIPETPTAQAVAALIGLQCKPVVAERAVAKAIEALGEDAPVEDLVREALKHRY